MCRINIFYLLQTAGYKNQITPTYATLCGQLSVKKIFNVMCTDSP